MLGYCSFFVILSCDWSLWVNNEDFIVSQAVDTQNSMLLCHRTIT